MSRCFTDIPSEHSRRSYPKAQEDRFYVCKNYLVQPLTHIEENDGDRFDFHRDEH